MLITVLFQKSKLNQNKILLRVLLNSSIATGIVVILCWLTLIMLHLLTLILFYD